MDDRAFDRLARAFATTGNRRSLLKGILGFGGITAASTVVPNLAKPASAAVQTNPGPPVIDVVVPLCPFERKCGDACCKADEFCCDPPGAAQPICLPEGSCCRNPDCTHLNDRANCIRGVCNQQTHLCEVRNRCDAQDRTCCPGKTTGVCYDPASQCCTDAECDAAACETCVNRECTGCPAEQVCCDETCCSPNNCCDGTCGENWCCTEDEDCAPCETCNDGECATTCIPPESCCEIGDLRFCVDLTIEGACCTAADCGLEDADQCLVSVCLDFQCGQSSECLPKIEKCCGNHTCVDANQACP